LFQATENVEQRNERHITGYRRSSPLPQNVLCIPQRKKIPVPPKLWMATCLFWLSIMHVLCAIIFHRQQFSRVSIPFYSHPSLFFLFPPLTHSFCSFFLPFWPFLLRNPLVSVIIRSREKHSLQI